MSSLANAFRLATSHDLSAIVQVVNAAFAVEGFLDGTRTDDERADEMMQKGQFLLLEDPAGELLASVYIELRGERGYFGMLAVDPPHQGKGFGVAAVKAAEDFCRSHGCKFMDLTVLSFRVGLPEFYRKLGYIETGTKAFVPTRPLKPGIECHSIIMSKPL
ncbi:MAG: GNAT family N-acetyltransferase [Bacteroidota bacterium]|nr:GNAT family N-acetyltransferase [Bacteroidota bacterium]MDP4232197.1 GNAT family N-acetyltransferase [Bacteroidota bacterium]MDP4243622.1 GNAT family N-acetyltransferase [Bacteroidota bacterium]MDP4288724.1 GNAT family N-acetyltransferase [Bacteroidota bacterium]